jgi:L-asparaginase
VCSSDLNAQTGALESFDFAHLYAHIPELKRFELDIQVKSFAQPLDSSEVSPQHWQQIASWITDAYEQFDGFVILHGTDTMAYTASALSFMLQGLQSSPRIWVCLAHLRSSASCQ